MYTRATRGKCVYIRIQAALKYMSFKPSSSKQRKLNNFENHFISDTQTK